jgi:4-hydroxybenzoate polyprenyltransferase
MKFDREVVAAKLRRWEKYLYNFQLPEWERIPDFGLYMDQIIGLLTEYLDYLPPEIKSDRIITAATINSLCGWLSPVALAIVMFYSYCKRFTPLAHIVLGISLGIAPVGAYMAVAGTSSWECWLLALVVMTWCSGFDIFYALQDAEFDRKRGLHSIPSHFSARTSLVISALLHVASVAFVIRFAMFQPQSWLLWLGCALFAAILLLEHILVTPTKQRNIGIAFANLNAMASVTLALALILNIIIFA